MENKYMMKVNRKYIVIHNYQKKIQSFGIKNIKLLY